MDPQYIALWMTALGMGAAALAVLVRIAYNTGRMAQRLDSHESTIAQHDQRLDSLEQRHACKT